jgi:hypothetical protein
MSARLMSSRTSFHRATRLRHQQSLLLELLYLAFALLLGALLAATTLAAASLQQTHARQRSEHVHPPSVSPTVHLAPRAAVARFDSK